MKFVIVLSCFVLCNLLCLANQQISHYRNDEKHIAQELDINNVPIDPECKFKTVWDNVRLSGISRSEVPNSVLKHITIVKFHYAGAWIAWTDEKGYHEPSPESYIPWNNFPPEIKEYYKPYYFGNWNGLRSKISFFLRTAQIDPRLKKYRKKRGNLILRRATSGVLCRELFNNVYIPYSELSLPIRTLCGYYENEAYIPSMAVLKKKTSTINDATVYVPANGLRIIRRFTDGDLVRITLDLNTPHIYHHVFIHKFKGQILPNHTSDLHIFKESVYENVCVKCKLSDHSHDKFFNFMFDRQSRNPCPVLTREYALIRKGTQKVGRNVVNAYQYLPDYDQKFPKDSQRSLNGIKVQAASDNAGEFDE